MKPTMIDTGETQEISLKLTHYDDIFSDFDIRPYSRRALSIDFLDEIKRAAFDKSSGGIELALFLPAAERTEAHELMIRDRLSNHFKKHHAMLAAQKRSVVRTGIIMVILGVLSMIAATLVAAEDPSKDLFLSFLLVFLEPASWFLLWEGMDLLIFNAKELNAELYFYRKMSDVRGHIHFKSHE